MRARKYGTRSVILLLGTFLFILFALGAFLSYRAQLMGEFSRMVTNNLRSYTEIQANEINERVEYMQRSTDMVAAVLSASGPLDEVRITQVIERVQPKRSGCTMSYLPTTQLAPLYPNQTTYARILGQLQRGEHVLTDVTEHAGVFSFSVLSPVLHDKVVTGVVRCQTDAAQLTRALHQVLLSASVHSYLVDSTGALQLPPPDSTAATLYERFRTQTQSDNQALYQAIEAGGVYTLQYRTRHTPPLFVATAPVAHNGWRLLNLSDAGIVKSYSNNILLYTVRVCLLFALCTALLMVMVYYALGRQQRRLRLSELRYDLLARFSDTVLFEYDFTTDTMVWSGNADQVLGLINTRMTHYERDGQECALVHPDDLALVRAKRHEPLAEGAIDSYEARFRLPQGGYRWCSCQYQIIYEKDEPRLFVGKLTDISTHKAREARLRARAESDGLTGVLNNASMYKETEKRLREGATGFFFVFDVDDFKSVNDGCGHIIGDSALRAIAGVLRSAFRGRDLIGRLGGDEFAAFMDGTEDVDAAARKARELVAQIAAVQLTDAPNLHLSASIGVARTGSTPTDMRALYAAADRAMYIAKRKGKNSYHIEIT